MRVGQVYWIGWGGLPVKVGYTVNVATRLDELQVACPYRLMLLRLVPGDTRLEDELHKLYGEKRIRGEWFALNETDVLVNIEPIRQIVWNRGSALRSPANRSIRGALGSMERMT